MRSAILAGGLMAIALSAPALAAPSGNLAVPQPAKAVELDRYLGRWFELARYENRFEKGCEGVTAEYARRPDGGVSVLNSCRKGAPDGKLSAARGKAKVVEGAGGAKLKVSFFGPFYADYWVLDRADDYSWSIVGEPSGRYLWLLSREATPSREVMEAHLARLRRLGYDTSKLRMTRQPPA